MQARYDTKLLPEGVRATGYKVDGAVISVDAEMIRSEAFCPECGFRSAPDMGAMSAVSQICPPTAELFSCAFRFGGSDV